MVRFGFVGGSGLVLAGCAAIAGCGGIAIYDGEGTGGAGATSTVTSTTHTASATTTGVTTSSVTTSSVTTSGGGPNLVEFPQGVIGNDTILSHEANSQTLGITATTRAASDFDAVSYLRLDAPSGATVFEGTLPSNNTGWDWFGIASMGTPQIDHPETFPLAQGAWKFTVHSDSQALASLWVRQTVDGQFHGGVVDINFFIAGDVTSADHATQTAAAAFTDWGGIELGTVNVFAIGPEFLDIDENNVFDALHTTFQAPTRPAINIIAVSTISGQFEGAAGFATGIPGSPLDHGSAQGGVVWMVQGDDFFDPIILRHEAGHFAGLFHTSEFDAGLGDPLDDTPLCSDVLAIQNDCPDFDFTMFPSGGSGAGLFSPHEAIVMQGSATYRGVYAVGETPMAPFPTAIKDAGARVPSERVDAALAWVAANAPEHAKHRPADFTERLGGASRGSTRFDSLAMVLEGIGCPVGEPELPHVADELRILGAVDPLELVSVGENPQAIPIARRRALLAAADLVSSAPSNPARGEVVRRLSQVVAETATASAVRAGAVVALQRIDAVRARSKADQ